ncbi:hypothetical protein GCM10011365_00870 [Marinicella pacifica]|uniref:Tetratricopeptide repeat protein n=1 Tax=Marinicella pacifica TaxID=1171543 RepID=A0A917CCN2_9GAMM|nr:tetratricopeptide repeat protein [Marinicella pacifica]GGF83724.1 hypothetical protein GCM10011365_00870 [Marinicella pacifica]
MALISLQLTNEQRIKRNGFLLFIGTCLIYALSLGHQFALDDAVVLTGNRFVQQMDFWSILTQDTFAGFFQSENTSQFVHGGRYRPLTLMLFAIIWSVTQSPWVFHLLNVLAFAATVVTIYKITVQLCNKKFKPNQHQRLAFYTAVLFAVHPIHTEVVNNIKGLDDILSLLLALIAWLFVLKSSPTSSINYFISIFFFMFLALMAKESAILIVPLSGLSLWFFQNKKQWTAFKQILPMIVAVALYLLIRGVITQSSSDIQTLPELMNNPFLQWHQGSWQPLSTSDKYGTILHSLGLYLYKVFLPIQLTHDYYPHAIPVTGFCQWQSLLPLFLYLALVTYTLWGLYKRQLPAFAWTVYGISLALFSNIPFTIGTLMAERFLYIPSLGICLLMAWAYVVLSKKTQANQAVRTVVSAVAVLVILAASWQTLQRSRVWHDNLTLFEADIVKSSNSAKLNNALAGALIAQSQSTRTKNPEKAIQQLERALIYLNRAIRIHPTYAQAYLLKGNALHYLGQTNDAIDAYLHALKLKPNFTAARDNLSRVQAHRKLAKTQKQLQEITQQAITLSQQGNYSQAIEMFTAILNTHTSAQYFFFRGVAYGQSGQPKLALNDFKQAEILTDPQDSENLMRLWQAMKSASLETGNNQQADIYQSKIDNLLSARSQ